MSLPTVSTVAFRILACFSMLVSIAATPSIFPIFLPLTQHFQISPLHKERAQDEGMVEGEEEVEEEAEEEEEVVTTTVPPAVASVVRTVVASVVFA